MTTVREIQELFDQKLYDEDYGRAILAKNEAVNGVKKGKVSWFYSEETGDNFQEIATLKKCTNGSRESFVNEWAKRLLDLANDTEKDLTKIKQKRIFCGGRSKKKRSFRSVRLRMLSSVMLGSKSNTIFIKK